MTLFITAITVITLIILAALRLLAPPRPRMKRTRTVARSRNGLPVWKEKERY